MQVIINGQLFDAEKTPICVVLSKSDKKCIANIHEDKFRYLVWDDSLSKEEKEAFINNVRELTKYLDK